MSSAWQEVGVFDDHGSCFEKEICNLELTSMLMSSVMKKLVSAIDSLQQSSVGIYHIQHIAATMLAVPGSKTKKIHFFYF